MTTSFDRQWRHSNKHLPMQQKNIPLQAEENGTDPIKIFLRTRTQRGIS
ncbi:MAG: hypothetical protein OJF47_003086 [Nitrospira sp.]|nr:MAG: hypothetical protein OJF47_003086 [Nitrospira sp.]